MHDITPDAIVIGIDTHKDVHVAVAINGLGARLAAASFPATAEGYRQVAAWAAEHGPVYAFGIGDWLLRSWPHTRADRDGLARHRGRSG